MRTIAGGFPVERRDVGYVVVQSHPVGGFDQGQVGPGHLVQHDDVGVGLADDEGMEVLQSGQHPSVVQRPDKVNVPGQD